MMKSANRSPPNTGKGRVKGGPNKVTGDVCRAICEAFEPLGEVDFLVRVGEDIPRTFLALLSRVLPAEIKAELSTGATFLELVTAANKIPLPPRPELREERNGMQVLGVASEPMKSSL